MSSKRRRTGLPDKANDCMPNSADYGQAFIKCGRITFCLSSFAIKTWDPLPTKKRGDQAKMSSTPDSMSSSYNEFRASASISASASTLTRSDRDSLVFR